MLYVWLRALLKVAWMRGKELFWAVVAHILAIYLVAKAASIDLLAWFRWIASLAMARLIDLIDALTTFWTILISVV